MSSVLTRTYPTTCGVPWRAVVWRQPVQAWRGRSRDWLAVAFPRCAGLAPFGFCSPGSCMLQTLIFLMRYLPNNNKFLSGIFNLKCKLFLMFNSIFPYHMKFKACGLWVSNNEAVNSWVATPKFEDRILSLSTSAKYFNVKGTEQKKSNNKMNYKKCYKIFTISAKQTFPRSYQ